MAAMETANFLNDPPALTWGRAGRPRRGAPVPQEIDTMIDARTASYGALVLRVGLGVLALAHGLTKLFVFGPAGTVGFFQSLGYPAIAAYYAMAFETLGGLALILGFYPRVAALVQLPILLGPGAFALRDVGPLDTTTATARTA